MQILRFPPERLYFGGASSNAGASNFPYVDLFNNGKGGELVIVLAVIALSGAGSTLAFTVRNTTINNPVGGETPVLAGNSLRAGQLNANQSAVAPTATMPIPGSVMMVIGEPHLHPWAVLNPGWSFTVVNTAANTLANAGFYWASLTAEEYFRIYPPIGASSIQ